MLLLVTIALVVVAGVSLAIGFASNSLAPIYLSIGCSVVAGILLVAFSRMNRRKAATAAARPTPAPAPAASTQSGPSWAPSTPSPAPAREPAPEPEPAPAERDRTLVGATPRGRGPMPADESIFEEQEDDDFPIEDYDELRANEILPVLPELDLDELDMVRAREERGKNRATVINAVDDLMDELEAEEDAAGGAPVDEVEAEPVEEPGVMAAGPPAAEPETEVLGAVPGGADEDFPFPDYDEMTVEEIIAELDDLDDEELDMVAEREEQGQNRAEILDRIDAMFEDVELDDVPPEPEPEPEPIVAPAPALVPEAPAAGAPAKKAAQAPVKKAPAKVPTAVKKAPVKQSPAKKAPGPVRAPAAAKKAPPAAKATKATKKQ